MTQSVGPSTADHPDETCGLHFKRYLASSRMWPIGFIIDNPYSPLFVERQLPNGNYRDAFEDLLALESGGQMIDRESRSKEAVVAKRVMTQKIHREVSATNEGLKGNGKFLSLLERMRAAFVKRKDGGMVTAIDEKAILIRRGMEDSAAEGQKMVAALRGPETVNLPASKCKIRGQWVASLITSGAISGWASHLYDSSDGYFFAFNKTEPAEDGPPDSVVVTELELKKQFEEGINHSPGYSPPWSTQSLRYPVAFKLPIEGPAEDAIGDPEYDNARTEPPRIANAISPLSLLPASILAQEMTAERTLLRNGGMSVKVLLTNTHTNGTVAKTEIKDDAAKVLEEVAKAHDSILDMQDAINQRFQDLQHDIMEGAVKAAEDDLD